MRLMLAACCLLTAGCSAIPETPQPVATAPAYECAPRELVITGLSRNYGESVLGMGLGALGVVEMWAGDGGTFTVTVSTADGLTCLVMSGEHWQAVRPKERGQGS